jgi:hypothetical protein
VAENDQFRYLNVFGGGIGKSFSRDTDAASLLLGLGKVKPLVRTIDLAVGCGRTDTG